MAGTFTGLTSQEIQNKALKMRNDAQSAYTARTSSIPKVGLALPTGINPNASFNYGAIPGFEDMNGGYTKYAPDGSTIKVPSNIPEPGMFDGMTMEGAAQGLGAVAGLANAYMGYKNYGLSKDKFAFEKAATNRSIENQAREYNDTLSNSIAVGKGLSGNTWNDTMQANADQRYKTGSISASPIG